MLITSNFFRNAGFSITQGGGYSQPLKTSPSFHLECACSVTGCLDAAVFIKLLCQIRAIDLKPAFPLGRAESINYSAHLARGHQSSNTFKRQNGEKGAIALSYPVNRGRKLHRCHVALTLSQRLFKKGVPPFPELSPSSLLVSHCLQAYINPSQGYCHLRSR